MSRCIAFFSFVALSLAAPAGAVADGSGSLLSGYGGPGQGQQVTLGSKLIPAKHGSGSLRAAAPTAAASTPAAAATPTTASTPAAQGTTTSTASTPGSTGGHHSGRGPVATTGVPSPTPAASAPAASTPKTVVAEPVRYPTAKSSSLPLSGGDVIALIAGLIVVGASGVLMRQLTTRRWGAS